MTMKTPVRRRLDRNNNANGFDRLNYAYEFEVASIASGATARDQINIDSDSNFHWMKGSCFGAVASAGQTDSSRVIPLINIQLTDTGSGRQLFSNPVPISTFFGTGEIPMILPLTQMFKPNSTIICEFENFDAAQTYTDVRLLLIGFKEFVRG